MAGKNKTTPEAQGEAQEVNEMVNNIQPSVEITEEAKTIGENDGLISTVSVEFDIPVNTKAKDVTVNILIKYPENYQGEKFHKDGVLKDVSIDTADIYIKKGIGTITE